MKENQTRGEPNRRRIGKLRPGTRIIIQKCRKCGEQQESDHLLISCPNRKPFCDGLMTPELDHYFIEDGAEQDDVNCRIKRDPLEQP